MSTIPVTVLTGFLGSGKTTVLNRLLAGPDLSDTVVIINEFGEIGLDHLLVERSSETLTLLDNGCICCTVRGDLVATIADLWTRREHRTIPAYRRILIETTGLADPAPILHTLMVDPQVTSSHRLESVLTTVDAVNGMATLDAHVEALKQAAVADRILLTKADLATTAMIVALHRRLSVLNPGAPIIDVHARDGDLAELADLGQYDPDGKSAAVRGWLDAEKQPHGHDHGHDHGHEHAHAHRHDPRIEAHSIAIATPVRWADFSYWLELMAAMRGAEMLRVKGIVAIAEDPERPVVVHGVQHVFHPPVRLDAWPSADRRTRLVFITRDLPRALLETTLRKFAGVGATETVAGA